MFSLRRKISSLALVFAFALLVGACQDGENGGGEPRAGSGSDDVEEPTSPFGFAVANSDFGLPADEHPSWGAAVTDFDQDGFPDLFVSRRGSEAGWFRNGKAQFETAAVKTKSLDRRACAWGEANGDGRPDLYCAQGSDPDNDEAANQLFIQTKKGFVEQAKKYGVTFARGGGRTVNWLDYDGDGDLDLFVGNNTGFGTSIMFRNDGKRFTETKVGLEQPNDVNIASSTWADWDRDGDPDLLVTQNGDNPPIAYENTGGNFRATKLKNVTDGRWLSAAWGDYDGDGWIDLSLINLGNSLILRNDRGTFKPAGRLGLFAGRSSTWFDFDNDGDLDLFVVQGARPGDEENLEDFLVIQREDNFVQLKEDFFAGPTEGDGDSVAASDFDRDGLVDLFVTNGLAAPGAEQLLKNFAAHRKWIGLDLQGDQSDPFGMGAVIRVQGSAVNYSRPVTDGVTARSQSEPGFVHLGIGKSKRVSIRVDWADGTADCVRAKGQIVKLKKGSKKCGG